MRLTGYTTLFGPDGLVTLAPGDELPDWAHGKVGDHLLDGTAPEAPDDAEDETKAKDDGGKTGDAEDEAPDNTEDDAPDFTKPAPKQRRPRR